MFLRMLNLTGVLAGADRMKNLPGALQQQVFAKAGADRMKNLPGALQKQVFAKAMMVL